MHKMRCFELSAAPGDPVLIEPIWIVLHEDPIPGIFQVGVAVLGSLEAAQKYIATAQKLAQIAGRIPNV